MIGYGEANTSFTQGWLHPLNVKKVKTVVQVMHILEKITNYSDIYNIYDYVQKNRTSLLDENLVLMDSELRTALGWKKRKWLSLCPHYLLDLTLVTLNFILNLKNQIYSRILI